MNQITQIIFAISLLILISRFRRYSILKFLLLISVPMVYFYPYNTVILSLSLLLSESLHYLLIKKDKSSLLIFISALLVSIVFSGSQLYRDMAIANVTNSQRGEHPNFQSNFTAKFLHNKTTTGVYYLQNFSDRLSLSTIFVSGNYPNLSKYLPLAFLFPWYIVGFILAISRKYKDYLSAVFLMSVFLLLVLSSIFTLGSSAIFVFSLIWFICFETVEQLGKISKTKQFTLVFLNFAYLGLFMMVYHAFQK